MPFQKFDPSKLNLRPLNERTHDLNITDLLTETPPPCTNLHINTIAQAIKTARTNNAAVILMYGAHVLRRGLGKYLIKLMEHGLVTHLATNGAGAIHDFELALCGGTCESVAKYISEGQFGLWHETGLLNDAVRTGAQQGLGFGEAAGKYINENSFPYAMHSVLAAGHRLQVPVTVHVGIGNDIVHQHPNCCGASVGAASMTDFLIYANSVQSLEKGVFLNVGSAVTGPEVYLKCLAMARNVAHQEGRQIADFTTAVFDMQPLAGDTAVEPCKANPHYYFRPWKTILSRTVSDGGKSYYVQGDHVETLGNLAERLLEG